MATNTTERDDMVTEVSNSGIADKDTVLNDSDPSCDHNEIMINVTDNENKSLLVHKDTIIMKSTDSHRNHTDVTERTIETDTIVGECVNCTPGAITVHSNIQPFKHADSISNSNTSDPCQNINATQNTHSLHNPINKPIESDKDTNVNLKHRRNLDEDEDVDLDEKNNCNIKSMSELKKGHKTIDNLIDNHTQECSDAEKTKMDILGNGLLIKEVVKIGDGGSTRPMHGDIVTICLVGELSDSATVDKYDCLSFNLGDGDVIQAVDMCVSHMQLNEMCTVTTDSKYAYGTQGRGTDIPPNASITYTITLMTVTSSPDYTNMTISDVLQLSESKRQRGNYHFERVDFTSAIISYTKALRIADCPPSCKDAGMMQKLLEVRVKCYNNLAASQLKLEAYPAAIKSCESVLKHSPENVKALFRKAKASKALGKLKEACLLLKKALHIEPESRLIHVELSRVTKQIKIESESNKRMYKKMFGLNSAETKPKSSQWALVSLSLAGAALVAVMSVGFALYRRSNQV